MKLLGIRRRAMRCVVVGVVVVATVSGCVVEGSSSRTEPIRRVLREGRVVYDLRSGLTREEVGFPPGRTTAGLETRGGETVDVTVILPDGRRFEFAAMGIRFAASTPGDEDIDPYSLDLDRRYPTADEAYEVLVDFDEQFGLDTTTRQSLEHWRDASARKIEAWRAGGGPLMRDPMVWYTHETGDLRLGVEATLDGYAGGVWVRFMIDWPPVPVPGSPGE